MIALDIIREGLSALEGIEKARVTGSPALVKVEMERMANAYANIASVWPDHFTGLPHFRRSLAAIRQHRRLASAEWVIVPVEAWEDMEDANCIEIMGGDTTELVRLVGAAKRWPDSAAYRIERRVRA